MLTRFNQYCPKISNRKLKLNKHVSSLSSIYYLVLPEEIQLIFQLFEYFRCLSRTQQGLDRDMFVRFCPLPGLWGHRIYKFIKNIQGEAEKDYIDFAEFLIGLRCLCRTENSELDQYIFTMFDLTSTNDIGENELLTLLMNYPDMGFNSSHNISTNDPFFQDLKHSVVKHIQDVSAK